MTHIEQTNKRASNHQSDGSSYVTLLATQGNISHTVLSMRNLPLPGSVEVQRKKTSLRYRVSHVHVYLPLPNFSQDF